MIKKLNSLKDFGIFRNFVDTSGLQEFKRYNLFYGWNGSGKSTFSKLFDCLNTNKLDEDFNKCSFRVTLENGNVIDNKSVLNSENDIKISVFNSRFVKENIDWDNIAKKLLYISKEKVEDKKTLVKLKEEFRDLEININKQKNEVINIHNESESFLTAAAKEVKTQFEVLSTDDNHYLNYDKRKLKKIIDNNTDKIKQVKLIAKIKEIDVLKMTARLQKLEKIDSVVPAKLEVEELQKLENGIFRQKNRIDSMETILRLDLSYFSACREEFIEVSFGAYAGLQFDYTTHYRIYADSLKSELILDTTVNRSSRVGLELQSCRPIFIETQCSNDDLILTSFDKYDVCGTNELLTQPFYKPDSFYVRLDACSDSFQLKFDLY